MSPIYVPGKVVLAKVSQPLDADAQAYVNAVEVADGQRIEDPVRFAINNFVIGCKADGIWNAIKASCILAGARTLTGALVPLVGAAPTNSNFVAGDYSRKTGLLGNGADKSLLANRGNADDPQDSVHNAVYVSTLPTVSGALISCDGSSQSGMQTLFWGTDANGLWTRNRSSTLVKIINSGDFTTGFTGHQRSASGSYVARTGQANYTITGTSQAPYLQPMLVFTRSSNYTNALLAFYSIGESLNLALLDARVTDLINAFAAAIP
jgi:hypothetical protein